MSAPRANSGELSLWTRQVGVVLEIELFRGFLSRRALPIWILCALAPANFLLVALLRGEAFVLTRVPQVWADAYGNLILRVIVYFGVAWIFGNAFRREIIERSLHYSFLAPIRREVLAVGKYLSALAGAGLLFCGSTVATYLAMLARHNPETVLSHLFRQGAALRLAGYAGVTFLAVATYGALFLMVGLFARSPVIIALALWGWESLNVLLPAFLKKVSIIFYLTSLSPLAPKSGPWAIVSDPAPVWLSLLVLFAVTAICVALSAWKAGRLEISYGTE
jgi:ABC-type transport system involved in multi-copper enzyme maturation permease subunit